MDVRTLDLRGEVLGADTTETAVARVGTIQLNWVSSAYCPKRDQHAFRRPESTVSRAGVGHQLNKMEDSTAARGPRAQGADEVHSEARATREVKAEPAAG